MNWKSRVENGKPILDNLPPFFLYESPPQNLYSYILGYCAELEERIEAVHKRLDGIETVLEKLISRTHGRIAKSDKMLEVEERFGKPIEELLAERKGKSARKIAAELGVSKSSIANWLKLLKY
jgi:transcriptional regulator of aromatic amino acid metabolism